MATLKFSQSEIFAMFAADAASLPAGSTIDTLGDFESQIRDLLENNDNMDSPEVLEVSAYGDAWETVQQSEFDNVDIEPQDFSSCESALDCLVMEANALLRACWSEKAEAYIEELAEALAEVVEGCEEFGSIDELIITNGCRLGDIPHAREFDAGSYSVCMWKEDAEGDAEIYYNFNGLEFRGTVYGVNQ